MPHGDDDAAALPDDELSWDADKVVRGEKEGDGAALSETFVPPAETVPGSWWTDWYAWMAERDPTKVAARMPDAAAPAAPGTYIFS